jgi:type IV secretion system protein VirD4
MVQAMKQTAGHGGRFAIITQSVPGLLSIPYTPEEVKAIESACQVKLYISASEDFTAGELETALGTRTGATVSRTREMTDVGFGTGSVTRSTEHRPLLSKQEIRDMDPNKIIILPERQNPILADRIKYYESKAIRKIHAAQKGKPYPFPEVDKSQKSMTMTEVREQAVKAEEANDEILKVRAKKMMKSRKPEVRVTLNKRGKKAMKQAPKGPLSAEGHAIVTGLMASAQNDLATNKGGSQAA